MLIFKNVALSRGAQLLFSGANFTLHKSSKIGLVGANGVGKSSLFALLRNEIQTEEGDFFMPPTLEIAHVAQETTAANEPALDYVLQGDQELVDINQQLSSASGDQLAELHVRLDQIDGYAARARAAKLLKGLGFSETLQSQTVAKFSGGWRMRLNLAQALMCRSDLLLLDEPTNHLDLDAVIWLQSWLCNYSGTLLLISHDRDFLDTVTNQILHIEKGSIACYSGNYSAFEMQRAEKLAQQQSAYQKQQNEVAHIQSFITRFKAKATKAKQAQSRVKALEKMEIIVQAHVDSPFHFTFLPPDKTPHPLCKIERGDAGYQQKIILKNINLVLSPGDRIGLLGPNGAGKSTLIKAIVGENQLLSGECTHAEFLKTGYFAQHQLEQLNLEESPVWHIKQLEPTLTEKEARNFLGGFGFQNEKAIDLVAPFSGGEKARLVLAILVFQRPNLLLLDEPTNHLDLEMRQALTVALQDYAGALVVVSHDRYLLRTVTDNFFLVANQKVQPFEGDLDDYKNWLNEQKNITLSSQENGTEVNSKKENRRNQAEKRQKIRPFHLALKKVENELEKLQNEKVEIEHQLTDTTLYESGQKIKLKEMLQLKAEFDKRILTAESLWFEASEQLEQVEKEIETL